MRNPIRLIFYAILLSFIFVGIVLIKGYTYQGIGFTYFWTIFVTVFMSSRIVGSLFYNNKYGSDENYNPQISFVIPCKNEGRAIYHTIQKCCEVEYPEDRIQIIAINDGSTDNTLREMQRAKLDFSNRDIKIVDWRKNRGKREGMRCGFKNANGEIIIQLDSDSFPDSKTMRYLITPFKDRKIGAVVGHTEPSNKDENILTRMQTAYYFMSFRALKSTESIFGICFCCSGCYSAYRKEYVSPILEEWNNEKFMGKRVTWGDDRALTNQILKQGYNTIYASEALAFTIVPNTFKQFFKQQRRWKQGWFVNSMKALKFIVKRDKFVSLTYFFPLIFLTIATPFIAFKSLIINPIFFGISPIFYILGIFLVSMLCYVHYNVYSPDKKYGKYMLLWSVLNMTFLSFILIFALYNVFIAKNYVWGTR